MSDAYYDLDVADSRGARYHTSQFAMLQPQVKPPARQVPARDRYRATQYDNPMYDLVEDDDQYDTGEPLDSFDHSLLEHPYEDRQRRAEQGRARLSLAPGPSKFLGDIAPPQSQTVRVARENSDYDNTAYQDHLEQAVRKKLSRFAYDATQPEEPRSEIQVGDSSSPALRAGQRRAEQTTLLTSHSSSRPHLLDSEQHRSDYKERVLAHPDQSSMYIIDKPDGREGRLPIVPRTHEVAVSYDQPTSPKLQPKSMDPGPAPPIVQGIQLVPVTVLPDRLRTIFSFPTFNAIQSKCFDRVFRTEDNFVLASPTGSGKTAILELAICQAINTNATGQYKVVYLAPTKALCSERQRDWESKFSQIDLKCAELTGDSDATDLRNVQTANIIVTTPEKWDSVTRKWKDHEKLMNLVRLFLIDEVHILKEDRGAVLETVVSRMKSVGTDVRFVALSATVPNFQDVAAWLGKNMSSPYEPAANERFGEEFRPVKLQKYVCGYVYNHSNDFAFEKVLDARLPEVIAKYSERKPIMVFCATRNSTVNTAKLITSWWISKLGRDRLWNPPSKPPQMLNKDLRDTVSSGVAFHHAGLDLNDRMQVEKGFLNGEINVICCTSTLAVGVNLPCHLVIIKNTVGFTAQGLQEYSDLEMMQMLGRAGRPQFDDRAVAVIMTRQNKVSRYEKMVTGQELLESKLHLNLIDHMNAEIGLGTIRDLRSARKWLTGTFLYVRLQQNPESYRLEGARSGQNIEEQVDDICYRDITMLREHNLVSGQEHFRCTEFGHAMARYYIHFETMKVFMGLQSQCSPSEILSAIAQATEFSMIRFRQGEKSLYKALNQSPSIRWSIPVNLDLPAQKVSLIIQSVLGSADITWDGEMGKHKTQYTMETQMVFKNVSSLIRCIIDCQIYLGDSISIHSALLLERSLGARAWDDSPLQMKQIEGIGVVAVRKLVNAGIRSMEDLEACEAHRIEALVGRNPPFGLKVLEKAKKFPKLRVSLHTQPSSMLKAPEGVKIQVKADMGFINNEPPQRFGNKLIYVCLLAETSDGRKIHFARISGFKLGRGQSLVFPALLTSIDQSINCYVMCDGIAGSMRCATVKPQIAPAMFPAPKPVEPDAPNQSNMSKRRAVNMKTSRNQSSNSSEDFGDDDINDDELMRASFGEVEFDNIENYTDPIDAITRRNTAKNKSKLAKVDTKQKSSVNPTDILAKKVDRELVQLANGKWACNHACKDKNMCKHLCCKTGVDKPPKKKHTMDHVASVDHKVQSKHKETSQNGKVTQSKLQLNTLKRKKSAPIEELDLTQDEKKRKTEYAMNGPRDYRGLHQLHKATQGTELPSSLHLTMHKKPAYCYSQGGEHNLSFMGHPPTNRPKTSSDYGDIELDEMPVQYDPDLDEHNAIKSNVLPTSNMQLEFSAATPDAFGEDDSLLGDAMIGLVDSQNIKMASENNDGAMQALEETLDLDGDAGYRDVDFPMDTDFLEAEAILPSDVSEIRPVASRAPIREILASNCHSPSSTNGNKFQHKHGDLKAPEPMEKAMLLADDVDNVDSRDLLDLFEPQPVKERADKEKPVPKAFKDLENWLFEEFGDVVELVDE